MGSMAFSEFRYPDLLTRLGLTEAPNVDLFPEVEPTPRGPLLQAGFPVSAQLGTLAHSESARSIWIVGPVLADFWSRFAGRINLLAGVEFPADPEAGLTGFVDFMLCRGPQRFTVSTPVLLIFEAKRDSIPDGLGQAIAGMVGAQRYNRRDGHPVDPLYGCVTTGSLWRFLRLSDTTVTVDRIEYTLDRVEKILGILTHMATAAGGVLAA
jgi:hypothetical protein